MQRDMSEPEHNQNPYNSRTKQDQKHGRPNEEQYTRSKKKSLSIDNLHLASRTQAALYALRRGLVALNEAN